MPEVTFRAAEAVLQAKARDRGPLSATALLTGIGLCGVCKGAVHVGGKTSARRAYRCSQALGHVGRAAAPVELYVAERVIARFERPDAADLLVNYEKPDVGALLDEKAALTACLEEIGAAVGRREMLPSQVRAANEPILKRITVIDAELADAGRVNILGSLVGVDDVRAAWEAMGLPRQRKAIDVLMTVTLFPPGQGARKFRKETVGIGWKRRRTAAK